MSLPFLPIAHTICRSQPPQLLQCHKCFVQSFREFYYYSKLSRSILESSQLLRPTNCWLTFSYIFLLHCYRLLVITNCCFRHCLHSRWYVSFTHWIGLCLYLVQWYLYLSYLYRTSWNDPLVFFLFSILSLFCVGGCCCCSCCGYRCCCCCCPNKWNSYAPEWVFASLCVFVLLLSLLFYLFFLQPPK